MFDGSHYPIEENIEKTSKLCFADGFVGYEGTHNQKL